MCVCVCVREREGGGVLANASLFGVSIADKIFHTTEKVTNIKGGHIDKQTKML